jgi:hypothetical protein
MALIPHLDFTNRKAMLVHGFTRENQTNQVNQND